MQFNSFEFILVFLPITIIGYFTLNKYRTDIGKVFLSIASLVFYAYSGISNTIILGLSVIFNYIIAQSIRRTGAYKRTLLMLGIFINIFSLLYFKYTNFTISLINRAFEAGFSSLDILLPLGISFITFQQIMYLVETSRDNQDRISFLDYVAYILYFPKLLLGHLIEPSLLLDQLNNKSKNH